MVLKYLYFTCFIGITIFLTGNGPLLEEYHSVIDKQIKHAFEIDKSKSIVLATAKTNSKTIELYEIFENNNEVGYVFIKEVKSCNLNGCSSTAMLSNNIGSEYYDLMVITDLDLNIRSISVLDYFSDYGYEIASKRYLKKYKHKNICDFSQQSPKVDGISGATVSYNALLQSIGEFCKIKQLNQ